jgi:hypothetical protein
MRKSVTGMGQKGKSGSNRLLYALVQDKKPPGEIENPSNSDKMVVNVTTIQK